VVVVVVAVDAGAGLADPERALQRARDGVRR